MKNQPPSNTNSAPLNHVQGSSWSSVILDLPFFSIGSCVTFIFAEFSKDINFKSIANNYAYMRGWLGTTEDVAAAFLTIILIVWLLDAARFISGSYSLSRWKALCLDLFVVPNCQYYMLSTFPWVRFLIFGSCFIGSSALAASLCEGIPASAMHVSIFIGCWLIITLLLSQLAAGFSETRAVLFLKLVLFLPYLILFPLNF